MFSAFMLKTCFFVCIKANRSQKSHCSALTSILFHFGANPNYFSAVQVVANDLGSELRQTDHRYYIAMR